LEKAQPDRPSLEAVCWFQALVAERPVVLAPANREVLMSSSKLASNEELPALERPLCPKCGAQMWLATIEPDRPDHDRRTFECPRCQTEKTEVVKYK
jgi:hypothetical protein